MKQKEILPTLKHLGVPDGERFLNRPSETRRVEMVNKIDAVVAYHAAGGDKNDPIALGESEYLRYKNSLEPRSRTKSDLIAQFIVGGQFRRQDSQMLSVGLIETAHQKSDYPINLQADELATIENTFALDAGFAIGVINQSVLPENNDIDMVLLILNARKDLLSHPETMGKVVDLVNKNISHPDFVTKVLPELITSKKFGEKNLLTCFEKGSTLGQLDVIGRNMLDYNQQMEENTKKKREESGIMYAYGDSLITDLKDFSGIKGFPIEVEDRLALSRDWNNADKKYPKGAISIGENVVRMMSTEYFNELPDVLKEFVRGKLLVLTLDNLSKVTDKTPSDAIAILATQIHKLTNSFPATNEEKPLENLTHSLLKVSLDALDKRIKGGVDLLKKEFGKLNVPVVNKVVEAKIGEVDKVGTISTESSKIVENHLKLASELKRPEMQKIFQSIINNKGILEIPDGTGLDDITIATIVDSFSKMKGAALVPDGKPTGLFNLGRFDKTKYSDEQIQIALSNMGMYSNPDGLLNKRFRENEINAVLAHLGFKLEYYYMLGVNNKK